jgi:O-antigen ligase
VAVVAAAALLTLGARYVQRFREYPWTRLQHSDRYQMAAGALRAWATAPVLGIGPGMHQHLWPHFAASTDGDRAAGRWPRTPNWHYTSYEVHNDWVQLLEEYGAIGLILFLLATGAVGHLLLKGWQREAREQRRSEWSGANHRDFALVLAAILAAAAMAFHSLGDFNLQIPATTWLLAALVAIPAALVSRERAERSRSAPGYDAAKT